MTFPSGVTIDNLGPEARCMTCHQGLESTDSVNQSLTDAAAADDDTPSTKLGFKNVHYFAAGATLNAGKVRGGYQYAGQTYDTRFRHAPGFDTCIGCHDQHSLEVKVTADEAVFANGYKSWTNRLLRASYNYQYSVKDPGAFGHNAKYLIEIMYDSLADVNTALPPGAKIDTSAMARIDPGHFNGAGEPARHRDANDAVDQSCSRKVPRSGEHEAHVPAQ